MSQALLLSDPAPSIIVRSGRPATTSREVARYFNKPHDDVLKSVRRLIDVTPENFRLGNFSESSYTNEQGKTQPMFIIYRDGFMLLVMGYTGKKALAIKLAYIEAFNAMEEELARRSRPALPTDPFPCSVEECRRLMRDINDLYDGKRHDLEHLKDRLVETTFNVTYALLRKTGLPPTAGGEGPGLHSTLSQCLFSMLVQYAATRTL